jgi:prepilin-type processing-associated H-X9-DG protein
MTLPEVLIVLGVLGILLQLSLPAILTARDSSRRTQCEDNLRQIGQALAQSEDAHKAMPQAAGYYPGSAPEGNTGRPAPDQLPKTAPAVLASIQYFLLPYLGEQELYMCWRETTQGQVFLTDNPNGIPPSFYLCPSDMTSQTPGIVTLPGSPLRLGVANYVANIQGLGHWWDGTVDPAVPKQPNFDVKPRRSDFSDGGSHTIAFAERYQVCIDSGASRPGWLGTVPSRMDAVFAWNESTDTPLIRPPQIAPEVEVCDPDATQSAHPGGMNVLMIDGSVQQLGSIDETTWEGMIMPSDGTANSANAL